MLMIPRAAIGASEFRALGSSAAPIRETMRNGRSSKPLPSLSRETTMPHRQKAKSATWTSKSHQA